MYVVDTPYGFNPSLQPRILKLASDSETWDVVGDDSDGFVNPFDVAVDGEGNLFVTNFLSYGVSQVLKLPVGKSEWTNITPSDSILGTGILAAYGLGVDRYDNVYISNIAAASGGEVLKLPYNGTSDDWKRVDIQGGPLPHYGL